MQAIIVSIIALLVSILWTLYITRKLRQLEQTYARIEEAQLARRRQLQNAKRTYPARDNVPPVKIRKASFRNPRDTN